MGSETDNPLATPIPSSSFNPESLEKLLTALSPDLRVCLKAHFERIDGHIKPPLDQPLSRREGGRCVSEAEGEHVVACDLVNSGLGVSTGQSIKSAQVVDLGAGVKDVEKSWALPIGATAVACKKKRSKEVLAKKADEERLKEEARKREEMEAAAAKKLKEEEVRKTEMKAKSLKEDKLELAKEKKMREAVKAAAAKDLQEKEGRNVEEDRLKRAKREKRMEARKAARKAAAAKSLEEKETATNELSAGSVQPNGLQNKHCGGATPRQQITKFTDQLTAKIGQGLLIEIRRLQDLLYERDTTLENLQREKSKLEEHVDVLEIKIRSLEESERRLQEENRDLGSVVGELRFSEQWDTETQPRVHSTRHMNERAIDLGRLKDEKAPNEGQADEKQGLQEKVTEKVCTRAISLEKLDDWKALNEKRFVELEVENAKRESEFAAMVKIFVAGEDKRLALEKRIETLEWDSRRRPRPTDTNR